MASQSRIHKPMSCIHALCGLPGSGKTTYAKTLERSGCIAFSADDWMIKLYGHHMPREVFDDRMERCTNLILDISKDLTSKGVSVVLDFGFWKQTDRQKIVHFAKQNNIPLKFYYLDVPQKELWQRLEKRNQNLSEGTFEITKAMLEMFSSWFEEPSKTEGFELIRMS